MLQIKRPMAFAIAASLLTLTSSVAFTAQNLQARILPESSQSNEVALSVVVPKAPPEPALDPALERKAKRLQARLQKHNMKVATIRELAQALLTRQSLLRSVVTVLFTQDGQATEFPSWSVSLQRYPQWMTYREQKATFEIDEAQVSHTLTTEGVADIAQPVDARMYTIHDVDGVLRADTAEVAAKPGWEIDMHALAQSITTALAQGGGPLPVAVTHRPGHIVTNGGALTLLAEGKSDFTTSVWARATNVRKALSNVHNVVVPAGQEFHFTEVLDYPIAPSNGWPMAKTIFGGWELRDAPGGGICQASTTVFRAALKAGLPIVDRKSHSLYVSYYEKYGVGLDATVFPGQQEFSFLNDTGSPIVVQSYTDGYQAYVNIYGVPDDRRVAVDGPFFWSNAPADLLVNGRAVRANEIVWTRTVSKPDGTSAREDFVSRYNAVPQTIVKKYTETTHASAL